MKRIILLFFILSSPFFLASCGKDNGQSSESNHDSSTMISSSSSEVTQVTSSTIAPSSSSQVEEEVDTKNLTTEQVEKWVSAIWNKRDSLDLLNDPKYKIVVEKRDDNLIYANVEAADVQIDTLDVFRINSDGFLEESGYFQSMPDKDWIVVSKKYLDTSMVSKSEPKPGMTEDSIAAREYGE